MGGRKVKLDEDYSFLEWAMEVAPFGNAFYFVEYLEREWEGELPKYSSP